MDNVTIHSHSKVLKSAKRMLFNAEYPPWVNPIELLFKHRKRKFRNRANSTSKLVARRRHTVDLRGRSWYRR